MCVWFGPPSPSVNTHFLYVSNGCHFPLGGGSKMACCQTMPYPSLLLLTSNSQKKASARLYCLGFFCALTWNKIHKFYIGFGCWLTYRGQDCGIMLEGDLHALSTCLYGVNVSLQGWPGSGWVSTGRLFYCCLHTVRHNVTDWEDKKSKLEWENMTFI